MALPASNKPHSAEKSTPVWLAIWCTWAGFANSQLLNAAFSSTNNICWIFPCSTLGCRSDRRKSFGPSAPIAYATSVSPPDEAVAWPGRRCRIVNDAAAWSGRRYWVLDITGAKPAWRCWMTNDATACPLRSSCKSPRTLPKCKYLITKELIFIAVRGGLNLCSPSTAAKVN